MLGLKYLAVLIATQCFFIVESQPTKKFFRKDYQYVGSADAFYKIHTVASTWQEAKDKCDSEGSSLFYADDEDEAYSILSLWNETQNFNTIYLGISAPYAKQVFETIDGKPITSVYVKWAPGEPNGAGNTEDCVTMFKDGNMNDDNCLKQHTFICKKSLESLQWNEQCNIPDPEYQYSEKLGSCYKFQSKPMNWADAYARCHSEQSHLAIINSKEEAEFLVDLTNKNNDEVDGDYLRGAVHLGFRDNNGKWMTINKKTPLSKSGYTEWGAHQPDGRGQEKCGSMFYNGKLNDVDCNEKMFFICELNLPKN